MDGAWMGIIYIMAPHTQLSHLCVCGGGGGIINYCCSVTSVCAYSNEILWL